MKTVKVKVYEYAELNDEAKEKARQWFLDGDIYQWETDGVLQDAEDCGLRIRALDYHSMDKKGDFVSTADDCADKIIRHHGKKSTTYKTALEYLGELKAFQEPEDTASKAYDEWMAFRAEKEGEFLGSLLEDYLYLLRNAHEYAESEKYISEGMEANGYTFTKDGKRFG
jgi:hypothetical protein